MNQGRTKDEPKNSETQKVLFIKISVSFSSLIPCLIPPTDDREKTERRPTEYLMTKKALFLRLSPKKVDLIPEKVVFIPKTVDYFPETEDLHFSPLHPNFTPHTRKIAPKSDFSCISRKKSVSLHQYLGILTMTKQEQEIIEYWTNKINVEQKLLYNKLKQEQDKSIREHNAHSQVQIYVTGLIITPDMERDEEIPIKDYEILQRNNVELTGLWWCKSGSKAYQEQRKNTRLGESCISVGDGTAIEGYYKIIGIQDGWLACYYSVENTENFVSQQILIKEYQLLASVSQGNRSFFEEGDLLHVESVELINNRYAIKWQVL